MVRGVARFAAGLAGAVARLVSFLGPIGTALLILALVLLAAYLYYLYAQGAQRGANQPDCDCESENYRIIDGPYYRQCLAIQLRLQSMAAGCNSNLDCIRTKLKITTRSDRTLEYGNFCDTVTHGPRAWPLRNGPFDPP